MFRFVRATMPMMAVAALLVLGTAAVSMAGTTMTDGIIPPGSCISVPPAGVPEIDTTTGVAALAFLAGAVLMIRGRRSR
jgi:hypothetical protein